MSFVIAMYVREGIVMASDSRLTLNTTRETDDGTTVHTAVATSDSNYKTFLTPNRVGISTYGAADIGGVPIAGYIESFIAEDLPAGAEVDAVAQGLLDHFSEFDPVPATSFAVAGYKSRNARGEQHVWRVNVATRDAGRVNPPGQQGAHWGGNHDILARLVQPVATLDSDGEIQSPLPHYQIPWPFFTLQDAIDFCTFAIRSTIDAIRFQPRPKSVGGPIDVLVIRPDEAHWVQRKQLRA